jgi:lipoate---protein ligase
VTAWRIDHWRGSAAAHHERPVPDPAPRAIWVHAVDRTALVLGSAQDPGIVDGGLAASWNVEVVRRRSGGGAVLLVPGEVAWLDVIVPSGDPVWCDDVSRSGLWLGEVWRAALADLGFEGAAVHRGALVSGPLGRTVCFGVVGPGEVTVDERKVVGVSQRRSRGSARFQCAVYQHWRPSELAALLRLDEAAVAYLERAARGADASPDTLVRAFLDNLP